MLSRSLGLQFRALWLASVILALGTMSRAQAQYTYELFRTFGATADSGANPNAAAMEASNGRIYGTTAFGGSTNLGTIYRCEKDGSSYAVLHTFEGPEGRKPLSRLAQSANGTLLGSASEGGKNGKGTIFAILADGTGYQVLHDFAADGSEGATPVGSLVPSGNGMLYGTTYEAGQFGGGTVFELAADGSTFRVLHHFGASAGDGLRSQCTLIEGTDSMLYGTTQVGGSSGAGTVFRIAKTGQNYQVLKNFNPNTEGAEAPGGVILGSDGRLYGILYTAGTKGGGAAYSLKTDGTDYKTVHAFAASEGTEFLAPLAESKDGFLYAVSSRGGAQNVGGIYRFKKDGTQFSTIRSFTLDVGDIRYGIAEVIQASDTKLYVTTPLGGNFNSGALARMATDGKSFEVIKHFSRGGDDAAHPRGELISASNGFLYGTTEGGGPADRGTVYRVRPDGSEYGVLLTFGQVAADAGLPAAGVIEANDGLLYGTTRQGGTANLGTVFRIAKDGSGYQILHNFAGGTTDGSGPFAKVIQGDDGRLYGVCTEGGTANKGLIFRMNRDGTGFSVLRSFTGSGGDGSTPAGELTQARDGVLYGVTYDGGKNGGGTVFKINPDGSGYLVLRAFSGTSEPATPWGGVLAASDGRLYGTSTAGGTKSQGTIYAMNRDGTGFVVLANLGATATDGARPIAKLVETNEGLLWGTCNTGGQAGNGTVFAISRDGTGYATVHDFGSGNQGSSPVAGLTILSEGILYGSGYAGGSRGQGSLFRLSSASTASIVAFGVDPTGRAIMQVRAVPGWGCHLDATDVISGTVWSEAAAVRASNTGEATLVDTAAPGHPNRFYRLRASPGLAVAAE